MELRACMVTGKSLYGVRNRSVEKSVIMQRLIIKSIWLQVLLEFGADPNAAIEENPSR